MLRMMRLGGATPAAIEYAKVWQCPVCASSQRPSNPLNASTRIRPYGFNVSVSMDLKYLKDAQEQHHVALSLVDAGTSWHAGALVKNRTPKHVVSKIMETWIMHYGVPKEFVVDQGGEFEAEFCHVRRVWTGHAVCRLTCSMATWSFRTA